MSIGVREIGASLGAEGAGADGSAAACERARAIGAKVEPTLAGEPIAEAGSSATMPTLAGEPIAEVGPSATPPATAPSVIDHLADRAWQGMRKLGKACAYSIAAGAVVLGVMSGARTASAHEVYQQVYEPTAICSMWTGQCFYGPPRVVLRPVPHSHDMVVVVPSQPGVVVVPERGSLPERVLEGVAQGAGQALGWCIVSGRC
ncbi:MAG: hypothetical protein IT384_10100 [Deltaproteobacteria bacterium]|nr:hypothetical protein [Deltaproteobacteria bacterium]